MWTVITEQNHYRIAINLSHRLPHTHTHIDTHTHGGEGDIQREIFLLWTVKASSDNNKHTTTHRTERERTRERERLYCVGFHCVGLSQKRVMIIQI